jgi:hypothetical protein
VKRPTDEARQARGELRVRFRLNPDDAAILRSVMRPGSDIGEIFRELLRKYAKKLLKRNRKEPTQ